MSKTCGLALHSAYAQMAVNLEILVDHYLLRLLPYDETVQKFSESNNMPAIANAFSQAQNGSNLCTELL